MHEADRRCKAASGEAAMPQPEILPAALAFLPHWWQEATETAAFDATLAGWVRACGWKSAGFVWPVEGTPTVAKVAPNNAASEPIAPAELQDIVRRLRAGEPTAVVSAPSGASRVYAPVTCPGRPLALLWADRPAGQSWSEAERAYIAL